MYPPTPPNPPALSYASEFAKEYIEGSKASKELNVGEYWVDAK
jgi:hypothetical protein